MALLELDRSCREFGVAKRGCGVEFGAVCEASIDLNTHGTVQICYGRFGESEERLSVAEV